MGAFIGGIAGAAIVYAAFAFVSWDASWFLNVGLWEEGDRVAFLVFVTPLIGLGSLLGNAISEIARR